MSMQKCIGVFSAVLLLLVVGCAPQPTPVPPSSLPTQAPTKAIIATPSLPPVQAPTKPLTQAPTKPSWQEEWDKTVAAAKKEGKLVIYTGAGTEVLTALRGAFKEKFGIDTEYVSGRGAELSAKIFAERRAGLLLGDLYLGGATTMVLELKPAGVLAPLKPLLLLPEVLDIKAYFDDEIPFIDKEGMYIINYGLYAALHMAVNSDLVKPGDIQSFADLLDPKWKGKIVSYDPTQSGAAARFFAVYIMTGILNPDFHRQLVKQEPFITRDARLLVEWVARGKYPVGLAPQPDIIAEFQKAGAPLNWVSPREGAFLASGNSGAFSYFDQAPHPNTAKAFVNWLMTKDGLTLYSKASLSPTARKDVPTDFIEPDRIRNPAGKYFNSNKEEVLLKEGEMMKLAKEIYGPLLK